MTISPEACAARAQLALERRIEKLESELVGLCASVLEHWNGNFQDLDVIVENVTDTLGLADRVKHAREIDDKTA